MFLLTFNVKIVFSRGSIKKEVGGGYISLKIEERSNSETKYKDCNSTPLFQIFLIINRNALNIITKIIFGTE